MTEFSTFVVEVRATGDGRMITGLAVPFDTVTMDTQHKGGERFARGAFKRTLGIRASRLPKLYRNHEPGSAVGTAVDIAETDAGLLGTWRLADTPAGNAALQEIREGVLDSLSVGFRAVRDAMVGGVREVREADLHEVSLVPMGAYSDARVLSVRSFDPAKIELPPMPDIDLDKMQRMWARGW